MAIPLRSRLLSLAWACVLAILATELGAACSKGPSETVVDQICACADESCVMTLMMGAGAEAVKEIMSGESKELKAARARMQACVVALPGTLGQQVAAKMTAKAAVLTAEEVLKELMTVTESYYANHSKTLPASTEPTPPLGTCCQYADRTCPPTPGWWMTPAWQALGFSVTDAGKYSYKFETSINHQGEKSYTLTAYGDLDCDGIYSELSLFGMEMDGELVSAGDVLKVNALE